MDREPPTIEHNPHERRHKAHLAAVAICLGMLAVRAEAFDGDLTNFFGNFPACNTSVEFDYLIRREAQRHIFENKSYFGARLPDHVENAFPAYQIIDKEDHIEIRYEVRGSYHGVPLKELHLWLGKENGIYAAALQFSVPRAEVVARFGQSVERTQAKALDSDFEEYHRAGIPDHEPGAIVCDWST